MMEKKGGLPKSEKHSKEFTRQKSFDTFALDKYNLKSNNRK